MTDAMSRHEIEDILMSIRKLVAHDPARPQAAQHPELDNPKPISAPQEKLVLTPELRVVEGISATEPPVVAEADPTTGQDTGGDNALSDIYATASDIAAESSEDPHTEQGSDDSGSLLRRIARQAGVDAPVDGAGARNPSDPVSDRFDEASAIQTSAKDNARSEHVNMVRVGNQPEEAEASDPSLEATLARLEAMLSDPVAPKAGHAPIEPPAAASPYVAPDMIQGQPDPLDDAPVIDEAMLHQLVAHIVRQELQGELGEKITRAIRKLVRAEVARELALRKI